MTTDVEPTGLLVGDEGEGAWLADSLLNDQASAAARHHGIGTASA